MLQEQLLLVNEAQVNKTMQLYSTMLVRHGVMQVGGTSGGKTTSRTVLAHALAKLANTQPLFNQNAPPSVSGGNLVSWDVSCDVARDVSSDVSRYDTAMFVILLF